MAMTIRWTPGHRDIAGNEAADAAARSATEGNVSLDNHLPEFLQVGPLPYSKAAL